MRVVMGQNEQALADFSEAIRLNPRTCGPRSPGQNLPRIAELPKAVVDLTTAIEIEPLLAELHLTRAAAYANLAQGREALEDCQEAIRLNPKCAKAYRLRGRISMAMHNDKAVIADLDKAIKLGDDNAHFCAGRVLLSKRGIR